ncbi:MAG: radical SAM protein [Candidatus Omnitrophota bacterium]
MSVKASNVYLKSFSCNTGSVFLARLEQRLNAFKGLTLSVPSRTFFGNDLPDHFADIQAAAQCRVCIIDGCAVMEYIHRDVLDYIARLRDMAPEVVLVLTGCAASYAVKRQAVPDGIACASDNIDDICAFIGTQLGLSASPSVDRAAVDELIADPRSGGVLVRWGCNNQCAYCVVPKVREAGRRQMDVPAERIVEALKGMSSQGIDPAMLSGVCISSWRGQIKGRKGTFDDLLDLILKETPVRIARLSLQPKDITPRTLELIQSERILRPWMIAVQHFSDRILKAMRRQYDSYKVGEIFDFFKASGLQGGVITDLIVGFPGETAEDLESLDVFLRRYAKVLARVKVSAYSDRGLTLSSKMTGQISEEEKKERSRLVAGFCARHGVPCEELTL